jgi:AcrR family transcriptional regulator
MPKKGARGLEFSVAAQRRRQIMDAVMASIAEEGLEKTTMRNVAQRAGVSTGTVAYYFRDKKDLVDATLLDASERYMERWHDQPRPSSPSELEGLVQRFLAPDNTDAAFVLQMIEVGLHNSDLRGAHQQFIEAGREMIEKSIRVGMDIGRYRDDIDPKLAAALIHGVLIWWGSELIWNATSEELAVEASRLAVRLLEKNGDLANGSQARPSSVTDSVRAILLADSDLDFDAATTLANAFELMYGLSKRGGGPPGADGSAGNRARRPSPPGNGA